MESVRGYLETLAPISDEEWQMIAQKIKVLKVSADEYLLMEGKACNFIGYILDGMFRSYYTDESGKQHSIFFHFEHTLISNFESFLSRDASKYSIQALTDAIVCIVSYDDREFLMAKSHNAERIMRKIFEHVFLAVKYRLDDFTMLSAEERYLKLVERNPDIFQKLPLGYISEYINIAPQSLSRIRKKLSQHKAESK